MQFKRSCSSNKIHQRSNHSLQCLERAGLTSWQVGQWTPGWNILRSYWYILTWPTTLFLVTVPEWEKKNSFFFHVCYELNFKSHLINEQQENLKPYSYIKEELSWLWNMDRIIEQWVTVLKGLLEDCSKKKIILFFSLSLLISTCQ